MSTEKSVYPKGRLITVNGKAIGEVYPAGKDGWGHICYPSDLGAEGHETEEMAEKDLREDFNEYLSELRETLQATQEELETWE